jgi:hypothetical protein
MSTTSNQTLRTPREAASVPFKHVSGSPLTDEETAAAVAANYQQLPFPRFERSYADPPLVNQQYALASFVPAPGASPDDDGVYGVMKIRGTFATLAEADERSEYLIRNVDSNNAILTTYVGRPFPIIARDGEKFGAKLNEIQLDEKLKDVVKTNDEKAKQQEEKTIKEIKSREKKLKEDVKVPDSDKPADERYTTAKVKLGQLVFMAYEYRRKLDEVKELVKKAQAEVKAIETPELLEVYMEKYMEARKEAGLEVTASSSSSSSSSAASSSAGSSGGSGEPSEDFIRFMNESNIDFDEIAGL